LNKWRLFFAGVALVIVAQGWGFSVHRHIHRSAVDALSPPLRNWFLEEADWLTAHAVDADKRKRAVIHEAPKHYVDLDAPSLSCLEDLWPTPGFRDAVEACCEDTLWRYGVLPWNVLWTYQDLVLAFDNGDKSAILRAASDLGHYVSDAHVPLHTSLNYNGQLTGQDGIHGLWETRLPELYGHGYDLAVGPPEYVPQVLDWIWDVIRGSHAEVGRVLLFEMQLVKGWAGDLVVREERGRAVQLQRVPEWCSAYDQALDGMVERQWRASIHSVSSLWMSAWVDAGQPDLSAVFLEKKACSGWRRLFGRCDQAPSKE
jgi:hypothetical protein